MKTNMKHRPKTAMARLLALLAMAVVSTAGMAQSRDLVAPADSRNDWSEFGLTGPEGRGIDPRANHLGKLNLGGLAVKQNLLHGRESGGVSFQSGPGAAREWSRHMVVREGAEAYNCALSFAVGGEFKLDGYMGSRIFGRTQTLNRSGSTVD